MINRIVLTGPSGAGKSLVADYLANEGYHVIDCDMLAKFLYSKKSYPCYHGILYVFGKEILDDKGYIDRAKLGAIVFKDTKKRKKLNKVIYPDLIRAIVEEIKKHPKCVIDMPVYFDAGAPNFEAEIVLVDAPLMTRIKRLETRGYSQERAVAQASALKFDLLCRLNSDLVIKNDKDPETVITTIKNWISNG